MRARETIALLCFCLFVCLGAAEVQPYPLPDPSLRSPIYSITLNHRGQLMDAPVLFTRAQQIATNPHDDTSWTGFAFSDRVKVTVAARHGPIATARVLPSHRQIEATINPDGTASFVVNQPGQLAVEINGRLDEHPLLIFADPLETDIPDRDAPNVRWFDPGVYNLGDEIQSVKSGDIIYLAPGALVYGRFKGTDAADVRLTGRGILAGSIYPPNPPNTYTAPHQFELRGESHRFRADGVTFLNSPHYNLLVRGRDAHVQNIKMIAWWFSTDGLGVGADSIVEDSFFKVSDDTFKLYYDNMIVRRNVVWQMDNGMVFQLSWNLNNNASGVRVFDIDVIRVEHYREANNRAVFGSIHGGSADLSDYRFEDIRIEGPIFRLVKLTALQTPWSRSPTSGTISDLLFRNITVEGPVLQPNEIKTLENTGRFEDITFENLTIGGTLITDPTQANFDIDPNSTSNIKFSP